MSYLEDYDVFDVICEDDHNSDIANDMGEFNTYIKDRNNKLLAQYNLAKTKRVGETFKCAYCDKEQIKKQYAQVFCSKNKSGRRVCKDKYHNSIDPTRWRIKGTRLLGSK